MQKYFTIHEIEKDIYRINEPYFYEHANLYLIKGTKFDLLIDCGLGLFNIKSFLAQKGFRVKVALTHSHFDHAGGCKDFLPDELLVAGKIANNLRERALWALEYLQPQKFDTAAIQTLLNKTPLQVCSEYKIEPPPLKIHDLAVIDLGNYKLEVVESPGHSDDSVVLYDRKKKLLITGDSLYNGEPYCCFQNSDRKEFKKSLEYLKTLNFDVVLPGHNKVLNKRQSLKVVDKWLQYL